MNISATKYVSPHQIAITQRNPIKVIAIVLLYFDDFIWLIREQRPTRWQFLIIRLFSLYEIPHRPSQ